MGFEDFWCAHTDMLNNNSEIIFLELYFYKYNLIM